MQLTSSNLWMWECSTDLSRNGKELYLHGDGTIMVKKIDQERFFKVI